MQEKSTVNAKSMQHQNIDYSLIEKKVSDIYPKIVEYRRFLHQNPELSGEEQ